MLMSAGVAFGASATNDVTGNWKGTLEVGAVKLRVVFKISKAADGALTAKMDSLDQGARDLPVETVTVSNNLMRLEVKMVQGVYEGTLDKAGTKATGQWRQGVQSLPMTLERSRGVTVAFEAEQLSPADLAASKQAAEKLAGIWNGTLAAGPANLRLRIKIARSSTGAASGTLDSLDQGAKDIPLSAITYKDSAVRFEARGLGAFYEGTLAPGGDSLTGQWHQAGQSATLDFKKSPSAQ